jgi:hypothetical protein
MKPILIPVLLTMLSCSNHQAQQAGVNTSSTVRADTPAGIPIATPPVRMHSEIAGKYSTSDSNCMMSLEILIKGERYLYSIRTATKVYINQELRVVEDEGALTLTFGGLTGDSPQDEITGMYSDGSVTIQNYGNSMNEYTKLGECGLKYIELNKVK